MTLYKFSQKQTGFALLLSLLVVSVVISIGLTLIDLTIKQLRLSSVSRDSEVSFHAANAGVECARFFRNEYSTEFETGADVPMNCFGAGVVNATSTNIGPTMYKYQYSVSWTVGSSNRCSAMTILTMSPAISGTGVTLNSVPTHIPGYPASSKTCPPGGRCTIISGQGYNQSCATALAGQSGVIQREVLLEL